MEIEKFENGNLHIQLDVENQKLEGFELIEYICNEIDLVPISEPYMMGNDCVAYDYMFNGGEFYYTINSYNLEKLKQGKVVELVPIQDVSYINDLLEN